MASLMRFKADLLASSMRPRMPAMPHISGDRPDSEELRGRAPLADQQYPSVIAPQEAAEFGVLKTRPPLCRGFQPAPQDRQTPQDVRFLIQSGERARGREQESGPHEILAVAVAHPARINTLLTRSHGAKVYEAQLGLVPAAGNPTPHPALMAIDTIPHHLPDEAADLLEALPAVELRHAEGGIIRVALVDQSAIFFHIGLAPAGRQKRI